MSAKWRALQHRHRYTYSAVVFPHHYKESLDQLPAESASCKFYSQLKHLISLNSTYAQVNHVKKLALAFSDLLANADDETSVSLAAKFYLEILFLENSQPLHRTLVSLLAKTRKFQSVLGNCFRLLCEEYGGVKGKGRRFCVSRAALSMMGSPKLGYLIDIVEECTILVVLDILSGLNGLISDTNDWSRPSPIVMEQCQEALSCMYYLLQRFPLKFSDLSSHQNGLVLEGPHVLKMVFSTILGILKSEAFSRDSFVAAGVSFCAALQVCLSPEELGLAINEGIFCKKTESLIGGFEDLVMKIPYRGDLFSDIHSLSVLSRLCLIRGILTAVSRTVLNAPFVVLKDRLGGVQGDIGRSVQTILYDGILPELCKYCESPTDSHFNFHALTVMQICLQQIKTSIQANLGDNNVDYSNLISEEMGARILRIIWNNLYDPLSQTVKQVHLIFDIFMDIQSSLPSAEGSERYKIFLHKIASTLLRLGPRCKGRYIPLASLTKRLGTKAILDMSPQLLSETANAYIDDDVCCAVTTFLKCFLECLRDECWSSEGVESGYTTYRSYSLPPFLRGLASGIPKLRSNLNTYALPVLLEVDVDSIFPMFAFISVGPGGEDDKLISHELNGADTDLVIEQKVAVLVSLLKVSRSLALIEGDIDRFESPSSAKEDIGSKAKGTECCAIICVKGTKVKIVVNWLIMALNHVDESLRIDAAESLFMNPKTSSLPSSLELDLMKEAVPLNMRCSSTAFQMKLTSLFRKFFSRVRTALEKQIKQGIWKPLASKESYLRSCKESEEALIDRADSLFHFMKWLSSFLFFSCYPSAPYERKIMAMDLILTMNNTWSIVSPNHEKSNSGSSEITLSPYSQGFTLPESTLLLVGSIVDSWDRLRESSFHILLHFPTPLPGISSPEMVQKVIIWAKKLVFSPRVRESDAGALTFRLIFRKYVVELGWIVQASIDAVSSDPVSVVANEDSVTRQSSAPVMIYITSLIDWLHVTVKMGEKDLSEACRNSFVHGVLLTLRYTFEELDWNSDLVLCCISEMKHALEKLLELVMRITSLALCVVSASAWHLPEDMDDMVDDDAYLLEVPVDEDASMPVSEDEGKSSKLVQDVGPSDQIVMVGCWLAMKEVSLLLGTIIRKVPLPTSDILKEVGPSLDSDDVSITTSDVILDLKQLESIGSHFLEVLLKMKHNGAIDKTRAGFTALCNRLLCSNDPRLGKLTESWMDQLMERTGASEQTVDDLLRRSAGIPAAFIAFFLSEPEGTPKRLLPKALRWLIDVANKSLIDQTEAKISDTSPLNDHSAKSNQVTLSKMDLEKDGRGMISKIRDEGVIPTVHAFNVLRAAFNDANLASDTSGCAAEALIISIRSFSSSYWEIRNSACLAYTALVRRMIGFLNIQKRESARRALTGLEFFHRYPTLHPFLLNELKIATELLRDGLPEHLESNLANAVHPSLCPILIVLSRLKPSTITSDAGDLLDPFLFMPFIRRCSMQSNLRVRVLASRALTGLISNEKLPLVLINIVSQLPLTDNQMSQGVSFNMIHGLLLQLSTLLDTNCRNLADSSKKDQILEDLIQVLASRSWIGSPRLCPCPTINGCFLKVLDNMLSIARTCQISTSITAIWKLLLEVSSECLDIEASCRPSYYDPTLSELRKQAATSYFNCIFQSSKEVDEDEFPGSHIPIQPASDLFKVSEASIYLSEFQERLVRSMSDPSYEVRIASFKWLFLFLRAEDQCSSENSIIQWATINLQESLVNLLRLEKHHKCCHYILKILFTWNMRKFQNPCNQQGPEARFIGNMDAESVFKFWDTLIAMYKLGRHAKTRESLICCMGICVKRFTNMFMSSFQLSESGQSKKLTEVYGYISYYTDLIETHADPSETGNLRKAAADSMIASGLLEQAKLIGPSVTNKRGPSVEPNNDQFEQKEAINMYARKVLDLWVVCIKLLEDEDVSLRSRLAIDVQKCFNSRDNTWAGMVPSQVDKVIGLCFDHLSSVFGHWVDYFDCLSRLVLNASKNVICRGDLVRRVFDKEIDNHHEEKLLICQMCCSHLESLLIWRSWVVELAENQEAEKFLLEWRTRFLQQLILFAKDYIDNLGKSDWIGGVGNHKDAFLPVYSNLLGLYSISKCIFSGEIENSEMMKSDIVELEEAINPFLKNPLIFNLYLLVIKLHEKEVGACFSVLFMGDGPVWDNFDHYFLLR